MININGYCNFIFPSALLGGSYFISIHHRNALETWSSTPIALNTAIVSYDFTNTLSKAYGNNMTALGDGFFAIWSGDISDAITGLGYQDGIIESRDYSDMENAIYLVLSGYRVEDITGDGIAESNDYSILENNVYYVISVIRP